MQSVYYISPADWALLVLFVSILSRSEFLALMVATRSWSCEKESLDVKSRTEFIHELCLQSFQNGINLETVSVASQIETICHQDTWKIINDIFAYGSVTSFASIQSSQNFVIMLRFPFQGLCNDDIWVSAWYSNSEYEKTFIINVIQRKTVSFETD